MNRGAFIRFHKRACRRGAPLIAIFFATVIPKVALATDIYWDGTGNNNGWGTASRWSTSSSATTPDPSAVPSSGDNAIFNITSVNSAQTVFLNSNLSAGTLTFNSTGTVVIKGNSNNSSTQILTLGAGGIFVNTGAGVVTIGDNSTAANIILGANQTWTLASGTTLNVLNVISGSSRQLTKAGSGTLTLSGANSYTGGTVINAGTLKLSGSGLLGGGTASALTINGGTLDMGGTSQTLGLFNGVASATVDNTSASGATLFVGNTVGASSSTFSGVIQNSGGSLSFTKGTPNTIVTLTGTANTFTGILTMNGGTLVVNSLADSGAGANGSGDIKMVNGSNTGVTLALTGSSSAATTRKINIFSGTLSTAGVVDAAVDSSGTGTLTIGGAYTSGGFAKTLALQGSNTGNNTVSGAIADNNGTGGSLSVIKNGAGTWVLNGANTFTGDLTINAGTLVLGTTGQLALGSGSVNVGNLANSTGNFVVNGGTLNTTGVLRVSTLGSTSFGAYTQNAGIVTVGNNINLNNMGGGATMNISGGTLSTSAVFYDAVRGDISHQATLTMSGTGVLSVGTFSLGWSSGSLTTYSTVDLQSGGTLKVGNIVYSAGTHTMSFNGGTLLFSGNTTVAALANTTFTITASGAQINDGGNTVTINQVFQGGGGLAKNGTGTLTLSGANTYTGGTTINDGMLKVNNSTGSGLGSGAVAINSGGTLGGTGTVSGAVTVMSGGHLAPGNSIGVQHMGTLTLSSGSVLDFQFTTTPAANDQIVVDNSNGLTLNGGGFNLLSGQTGSDPNVDRFSGQGLYNLIQYSGTLIGNVGSLSVLNKAISRTYTFANAGNWITLTIGGIGAAWNPLNPNDADHNWQTAANWNGVAVGEGSTLLFDGHEKLTSVNDFAVNTWFAGIVFTNTASTFTLTGAALNLRGNVANISNTGAMQTIDLALALEGGSRIFNAQTGDIAVGGTISQTGGNYGLVKTGSHALILTGNNSYTGATEIQGGAVRAADGVGLPGTSNLELNGGVFEIAGAGTFTRSLGSNGGSLQWTGSGGFSAYGGTGTVNIGGASATLTWNSGSFVHTGDSLMFSSSGADSTVRFLNPIDLAGGTRVFVVADGAASTDVELVGKLSGTGSSSMTKQGAGTMLLSANNNYSGTTTINAGTLLVGGTLTSGGGVFVNAPGTLSVTGRVTSPVTVDGTLAGTGTLTGGVTVNSGGILSPGMGDAGVLNVGTLSLADNFVYNWQVSAMTTDRVDVATAGGLTFTTGNAWTLNLEVAPSLWQGISHTNDTFVLFNVASGGAPIGLTNALFGGSWNTDYAQVQVLGNQVVLTGIYQPLMLAIPEPNVLVLWLSSIATIYAARRRQRRKRS